METDKKKNIANRDVQKSINFLEEIFWLLDANKDTNFRVILKLLKEWRNDIIESESNSVSSDTSYSLFGVLPSLLKDKDLFPTNESLINFSEEVLSFKISKKRKAARTEIIGRIVSEFEDYNEENLRQLSKWAKKILDNKIRIKSMQIEAKSSGNLFSWNEAIQKLTGGTIEQKN